MTRDLASLIMRIISVALLPFYVLGYGLYGARVWLWNWTNRDPYSGNWEFVIPKEDK